MTPRKRPDRDDDLLAQAEQLVNGGYALAAGMTARVALERRMRRLCQRHGLPSSGINSAMTRLRDGGALRAEQFETLIKVGKTLNYAAHGCPQATEQLIREALTALADLWDALIHEAA